MPTLQNPSEFLLAQGYKIERYEVTEKSAPFFSRFIYTDKTGQTRQRRFKLDDRGAILTERQALESFARAVYVDSLAQQAQGKGAQEKTDSKSEYIGERGTRYEFTATVKVVKKFTKKIEGQEHDAYFTMLVTDGGNLIKYWNVIHFKKKAEDGSKETVELGEGMRCTFNGTVHDHTEYKGEKFTTVQRIHVKELHE